MADECIDYMDEYCDHHKDIVFCLGIDGESIPTIPTTVLGNKCIEVDPKMCNQGELMRMYEQHPWTRPGLHHGLSLHCGWRFCNGDMSFFKMYPQMNDKVHLAPNCGKGGGLEVLTVQVDANEHTIKVIDAQSYTS